MTSLVKSDKSSHKSALIKNFFSLSFSIMLVLGVHTETKMVASAVYSDLQGVTSQIINNLTSMLSSFLLAPILNNIFGFKKTLISIEFLFFVSLTAYFYPKWWTIIPGKLFFPTKN